MEPHFPYPSDDKAMLEHGDILMPRFDADGLVTAVVTDASDGELLMLAHMNEQALRLTIETGIGHFFSRSRRTLWKKGETSGNVLEVKEMRVDCDQDAVWLKVDVQGDGLTCHTGARSCFYRIVSRSQEGVAVLTEDRSR